MKKYYYFVISALALSIVLPSAVRAEDSATASANLQVEATMTPPPAGERPIQRPGLPVLREQLRVKTENIQNNEEVRNRLLGARASSTMRADIRLMASTTRMERKDIRDDRREDVRDIREEGRERMKTASSSEDRHDIRKEMRKDAFEVRKGALIRQLNVSLNNLKQIRERISSRIDKAVANGKDMTEAKSLLIIADAKIAAAELAITEITAFAPESSVAAAGDATASSTVDLTKPREMGEKAIKALKDAHKSLVDVVRAIAHALGADKTATTTPEVTATTTATTTTSI